MKIVKTYKEATIVSEYYDNKNCYMMFIKNGKDEYIGVATISEEDTKNGLKTNYLYDLEIANKEFNVIKLTSGRFYINRDNKLSYFGNIVTYKK